MSSPAMRLTAAFFVLALVSASAIPSEWMLVSDREGVRLEFDPTSIVRRGDTGTAWDRTVSEQPRATPASGDVAFHSVKTLVRYDCARRTAEPIVRSFAFADGGEVLRQSVEGAELPQPVVPDTPRERMLALVCAAKPKAGPKPPQVRTAILPGPAAAPAKGDKPPVSPPAPADATTDGTPGEAAVTAAKAVTAPPASSSAAAPAPGAKAKTASSGAAVAKAPKTASPEKVAPAKTAAPGKKPGQSAKTPEASAKAAPGGKPGPKEKGAGQARATVEEAAPAKAGKAAKTAKAGKDGAETPGAGAPEARPVRWSYEGAQHWHKLSSEFAACAEGKRQSPIDIRDGVRVQLEPIRFDYRSSPLRILNTGHTVEVAYQPGSAIVIGETTYELVSFHFHHPAEERINGRVYEMSAHLVHKAKDGRLAMVAVLVIPGDENPFIKTLWNHLPLDVGLEEHLASVQIDVKQLLPRMRGYYTYMGSLTEPPCTEGVRWVVMRTPVQLSRSQIATFTKLYKMNARPVQAANGRLIKEVL